MKTPTRTDDVSGPSLTRRCTLGLATAALAVAVTGASVAPSLLPGSDSSPGVAATAIIGLDPAIRIVGPSAPPPQAAPAVRLVSVRTPVASTAATSPASWWDPWGNYGRCVLGIGVPIGVAWYFVTTLGTRAALGALRGQPLPPWAGAGAKRCAEAVWNSCSRFIAS